MLNHTVLNTPLTNNHALNIAVIGTGYVGLVGGTCLASLGHKVICVDQDQRKITNILNGILPIYEEGLEALLAKCKARQHIHFTTNMAEALKDCDVVFVAVGTPTDPDNGRADLSYIMAAAKAIADHASGSLILVHKSTVPVGTGDMVEALIAKEAPEKDIEVVSNPEFLREGQAINDFMKPDRIVIGANSARGADIMRSLYQKLVDKGVPLLSTDRKSAEMIKYAANSFLAVKVAFINELADLCEKSQANIDDVAKGIGLDRRISPDFLNPGPGFGGSCFPKDTNEMAGYAKQADSTLHIVEAAITANHARKEGIEKRIANALAKHEKHLSEVSIALLGLAFKANTDDIRESASMELVQALGDKGAALRLHDPAAMENAQQYFIHQSQLKLYWAQGVDDALKKADIAVIMTEWPEYRALEPVIFAKSLQYKMVIDFRNLYDPLIMRQAGIDYISLGRV